MNDTPRYYVASGKVGPAALPWVVIAGGFGVLILAVIYSIFIRYNPFIYFSFIATAIFGIATGLFATAAAQAGKSRSLPFNLVAALLLAGFGIWAQWVVWVWLHDEDGRAAALRLAGSGPAAWSDFFAYTADHYHLSIGRLGRSGAALSADNLRWIWIGEAVLIALGALLGAAVSSGMRAYCEQSGTWATDAGSGHLDLDGSTPEAITSALRSGRTEPLRALPVHVPDAHAQASSWQTLALKLLSEPSDPDFRLLSVSSAEHTRDDKDRAKVKTSETPLIERMFVLQAVFDELRARFATSADSQCKAAA